MSAFELGPHSVKQYLGISFQEYWGTPEGDPLTAPPPENRAAFLHFGPTSQQLRFYLVRDLEQDGMPIGLAVLDESGALPAGRWMIPLVPCPENSVDWTQGTP